MCISKKYFAAKVSMSLENISLSIATLIAIQNVFLSLLRLTPGGVVRLDGVCVATRGGMCRLKKNIFEFCPSRGSNPGRQIYLKFQNP